MAGYTAVKWEMYLRLIGLGMQPKAACAFVGVSSAAPYVKAAREPAFKAALMDMSQRGQILSLAYPDDWVYEDGEPILSADFEKIPRVPSDRLAPWVRQQYLSNPLATLASQVGPG